MAGKIIDWIGRLIDISSWSLYLIGLAGISGAVVMGLAVSVVSWAAPYAPIIMVLLIPFAAILFSLSASFCIDIFTRKRQAEFKRVAFEAVQLASRLRRAMENVDRGIRQPGHLYDYLVTVKVMRDAFERLGYDVPKPDYEDLTLILREMERYLRLIGLQIQQGNWKQAKIDATVPRQHQWHRFEVVN